jgi:hypothetical protein
MQHGNEAEFHYRTKKTHPIIIECANDVSKEVSVMRVAIHLFNAVIFSAVLIAGPIFSQASGVENRFVKIKKSFANVYEFLDPKSKIVKQAKRGDYFELVYEGTSWYQIKYAENVGWVERRAGNVVENPSITILSIPVGTFVFFIVLLIATFIGTSLFIYRQKSAEL